MKLPTRDELTIGDQVEIQDRSGSKCTGAIEEFLTKAQSHTYGIMVKLGSGQTGRVQTKLDDRTEISSATSRSEVTAEFLKSAVESVTLELKESAFWSSGLNKEEIESSRSKEVKEYGTKASLYIFAKVIASFLNTEGGQLIIGVTESKDDSDNEIVGIEREFKFLKDKTVDGYKRRIRESIFEPYFSSDVVNSLHTYVEFIFPDIDGKKLLIVEAQRSDEPVTIEANNDSMFFVRGDGLIKRLKADEILAYYQRRFS